MRNNNSKKHDSIFEDYQENIFRRLQTKYTQEVFNFFIYQGFSGNLRNLNYIKNKSKNIFRTISNIYDVTFNKNSATFHRSLFLQKSCFTDVRQGTIYAS